ncbi:hypothetical protein LY76DRAFT_220931 [Colletotrichum caudatum]|nr:hypothetical protein LY76DRAFT_220931 [Colletotrichum caudatum]
MIPFGPLSAIMHAAGTRTPDKHRDIVQCRPSAHRSAFLHPALHIGLKYLSSVCPSAPTHVRYVCSVHRTTASCRGQPISFTYLPGLMSRSHLETDNGGPAGGVFSGPCNHGDRHPTGDPNSKAATIRHEHNWPRHAATNSTRTIDRSTWFTSIYSSV